MFKKAVPLLLVFVLVLSLTGCTVNDMDLAIEDEDAWKIGIMSCPVTPNEEAYRMAQNLQQRYGTDRILHTTYPDRFMQDQETLITNLLEMAFDPQVKAIIIVQAVPGTVAAVEKVREIRPDMLIIVGLPQEDPDIIAAMADIILDTADIKYADHLVEHAAGMGAEVLVHYSFPRHMSFRMLTERRQLMQDRAEELGMVFINETVPDPAGDSDISGTQQYIVEDVSLKVDQYGENIVLFGTNYAIAQMLNYQAAEHGGLIPVLSDSSSLPEMLGIRIPDDKKDDLEWITTQIEKKVAEQGVSGRIISWPVPVNMLFLEVGVEYAFEWISGNTDSRVDKTKLHVIMESITAGPVHLVEYSGLDNYLIYSSDIITFSTRP